MENKENKPEPVQQNATFGAEIVSMHKTSTYDEFILWFAMPMHEKRKMGLETIEQFAEYQGVHRTTITRWKKRYDFLPRLKELRDTWGKERTQDVIAAIYFTAISKGVGAPASQKLWMQVIEGWSEKMEIEHTKKVELTVNDIRFIIEQLPEEYKEKFYGYLRDIFDTAQLLRLSGQIGDVDVPDERTEEHVPQQADNDAPDAPKPAADEMAESDQGCIRKDMVWQVQPHNYKGTARWW